MLYKVNSLKVYNDALNIKNISAIRIIVEMFFIVLGFILFINADRKIAIIFGSLLMIFPQAFSPFTL